MGTGSWGRATLLFLAAGIGTLVGGPVECAAQAGADPVRERMSLGAAMAEARRSPFHAGATGARHWNGRANEAGVVGTAAPRPHQTAPGEEHPMSGGAIAATFVLAELSHVLGGAMLYLCARNDLPRAFCLLGPVLPVPIVALPTAFGEIGTGRAFRASAGGWLGGVAAWLLVGHATGYSVITGLVSGLVHAGITTAILRG